MSDRELLELAAKAIGQCLHRNTRDECGNWGTDTYCTNCGKGTYGEHWNPLIDDGDRYRLIAKLKLSVDFKECTVWKRLASGKLIEDFWGGDYGDEPHAILRVAAEIGKATPSAPDGGKG